jgi:hypothetical protein
MGGMEPLRHRAVAHGALSAVALKHLDLEPLLIGTTPRLSEHVLAVLEERERLFVDGITSRHSRLDRTELHEKELLLVVPVDDPSSAHRPKRAIVKHHKDGQTQPRRRPSGFDPAADSISRARPPALRRAAARLRIC